MRGKKLFSYAFTACAVCAFVIFLSSCATRGLVPRSADPDFPFPESEVYAPAKLTRLQKTVVEGGLSLVGRKELVVHGVWYPSDCTGVVRAAYAFAGVDLAYRFSRYAGNGVRRLYLTLRDEGLLYAVRYPAPGDLIFWDDTYDADRNGRADDEFTHVGLVTAVDAEGTISYLHYNYRTGPVVERMNLFHPEEETLAVEGVQVPINSPMRMRSAPKIARTNAAQLFRVFGKAYDLPL